MRVRAATGKPILLRYRGERSLKISLIAHQSMREIRADLRHFKKQVARNEARRLRDAEAHLAPDARLDAFNEIPIVSDLKVTIEAFAKCGNHWDCLLVPEKVKKESK